MIDLYAMSSPNVTKVTIMLEEVAETYRLHFVDVFHEQQFAPDFLAISPTGKVPAIIDQDAEGGPLSVFESGAILLYLAEKHGLLQSTDTHQRSVELQWMMVQVGFMGPMAGQAVHFTRFAPAGNDYARERYYSQCSHIHKLLDRRLAEATYFGGGSYSVADVAIFPWVSHMQRFFPWIADKGLGAFYPNIARWYDLVAERPAVKRGIDAMKDIAATSVQTQATATPRQVDRFLGRGVFSATPIQG